MAALFSAQNVYSAKVSPSLDVCGNDPEGVQHVMVKNAKNYIKSPNNTSALKPILGKGFFVSEGDL